MVNITDFEAGDVTGFGLAGWRLANGKIELVSSKRVIDLFPQEIVCNKVTYTLEQVVDGAKQNGRTWVNAEYV